MSHLSLREKQSLFVQLIAKLVDYAYEELGYELTYGEAWRTPEQALLNASKGIGSSNSLHIDRLAVDFNLFVEDRYCPDSEAHRPLGEYWEGLHELCRWGGRFLDAKGRPKPDGNHYSLEHDGRK